jgi:CRP/FNR family nitrogen fixation transcriptional regulator
MLVQPIETTSKRPIVDWHDFTPSTAPLFACAPEVFGISFTYVRDEEIYGEEEDTQFIYKIVTGAVRTSKLLRDGRRQIGRFYLPGELLGLELGKQHHFTAEAVIDSKILLFPRRQIEALAQRNMDAARELWLMTASQLRHAEDHLLLLGRKTALERLAAFLIEMDSRHGDVGFFELPMSRRDIADYLGLTLETVSRGFSELQKQRTLELNGARHVALRNRQLLAAMGE